MTERQPNSKAIAILNTARDLMMESGYNGFSFRDIAEIVGIKSASIHYHFATKPDLAEAVAKEYRQNFRELTAQIEATSASDLMREYGGLFVSTLQNQRGLCLCGVLAADVSSLPERVRSEVALFFADQYDWVTNVLRNGQATGEIRNDLDAGMFAKLFVSSLEGSMLVARGIEKPQDLEASLGALIQLSKA